MFTSISVLYKCFLLTYFLTHFEVGSACKEFERKRLFECSVFFCKHCSSNISHNIKSFSNLATHHKVNKYKNCLITVYIPQIIFTDNNIFFQHLKSFSRNLTEIYLSLQNLQHLSGFV